MVQAEGETFASVRYPLEGIGLRACWEKKKEQLEPEQN